MIETGATIVVQALVLFLTAPLLVGFTRRVKARLQMRRGPGVTQPYRDLHKLWRKGWVQSEVSGPVARIGPAVIVAAILGAALLVPTAADRPPLVGWGDALAVVGLLALARFTLALLALDAGSAFGGMGSSREVSIAALIEPGLVLALSVAAIRVGSTDLGTIALFGTESGAALLTPAYLIAGAAFAIVVVAESGHLPVDNPDTHLELTMVHEGMLLETAGRELALLGYAAQLRQALLIAFFLAIFLPFGAASEVTVPALAIGAVAFLAKLTVGSLLLALLDACISKLRILRLTELLGVAALLALLALAVQLWLTA